MQGILAFLYLLLLICSFEQNGLEKPCQKGLVEKSVL